MTPGDDPGRFLVEHRAPDDLLHTAMSRAEPRDPPSPVLRALPSLVAAAAALVIGGIGGWSAHGVIRAPAPEASGPPAVLVANAPDVVPVRLVIHAPDAEQVAVAGSFNGWNAASVPLERADDGTWHTTLRLAPGRYEYLFVLDGTEWVGDPTAPLTAPDDFGQANAILEV